MHEGSAGEANMAGQEGPSLSLAVAIRNVLTSDFDGLNDGQYRFVAATHKSGNDLIVRNAHMEFSPVIPKDFARFSDTAADAFGDPETLLSSRDWLQSALEATRAKVVGKGCGCGQADIDILLDGHRFNVSIRPT